MRLPYLVMVGLLLGACGTKGPLVLPPTPSPTAPAAAQPTDAAAKSHGNKTESGGTAPEINQ